ncbi:MAG: hypothetical protein AVDCRST_MAG19-1687 [uncultured Thermomicrobiales bacterium]|uniref:Uncharacterized protein n=1 Tax=uncultured Thermomicrobiales bacterium TaxID=1645740 RepID=A0A6J4UVG7_9BACT|nr:MAG: hypothetical protein AVDCRST_MAG19-1687 [uncultured Thermomicrobiales bacterium]
MRITAREAEMPKPAPGRLLRFGFVKIDGKGWFDTDGFAGADVIGASRTRWSAH